METDLVSCKINLKKQFLAHRLHLSKKQAKIKWYRTRRRINKWLRIARKMANFVIDPANRQEKLTTRDTKHLGKLPSAVANQVIRKYKNDPKCKSIHRVNLVQPACSSTKYPSVRYDSETKTLEVVPLKLKLKWSPPLNFLKINQVQVNAEVVNVCVTVQRADKLNYLRCLGVDLNVKGNLATVGQKDSSTSVFLGKDCIYRRVAYKMMRSRWQRQGKLAKVKAMGNKESRIMNDVNHKIAKDIVDLAVRTQSHIALEELSGIRTSKSNRHFNWFKHSWAFYDLQMKIKYKAETVGIKVFMIDPSYTSQDCSNCKTRYKCKGKLYSCNGCGLKIHRDVNASYNIEERGNQALLGV